jgi:hypothetical protein
VQEPSTRDTKYGALVGVAFLVLAGSVLVAPFLLMLVPNPVPIRVGDVSGQEPGTFLETGGAIYRVFPRADRTDALPADSLRTDEQPTLWVRYRQLDSPDAYALYTLAGAQVEVDRDTTLPNALRLRPQKPLEPGGYYAAVAREGLFGGMDYVYFEVAAQVDATSTLALDSPGLFVANPRPHEQ